MMIVVPAEVENRSLLRWALDTTPRRRSNPRARHVNIQDKYKYNKMAGALQEAAGAPPPRRAAPLSLSSLAPAEASEQTLTDEDEAPPLRARRGIGAPAGHAQAMVLSRRSGPPLVMSEAQPGPNAAQSSLDPIRPSRFRGMFSYIVEEGQRVLVIRTNGTMEVVVGPKKVSTFGRRFRPMAHHVAHPGEFLIVRFRDGRQEHLSGPAHVWFDMREHLSVSKEDALQIATKEAIVVYSEAEDDGEVSRRIVEGPAVFVPEPGEWLHSFSWHGSRGGSEGYRKVPNALVFQKLWLLPDQMYHDVPDVRTADDAVLTIKLMLFFELVDIETMLATTHDPIGDFVNAATSDVVDFLGKHDLASFKRSTEQLNDLATYRQLTGRADQCGYRINKVVYRGYEAPPSLQQMLEQAIESRTRLELERATEQQAQELEDFKLERHVARAERQRQSARLDAEQLVALERARNAEQRAHLEALGALGVDLTALLTQGRADQIIELRGDGNGAHVHLAPPRAGDGG